MKLVYLAVSTVAGIVSIPFIASGAYGLWLYPGCRHALEELVAQELASQACAHSNLIPGLVALGIGLILLVASVLAAISRRRHSARTARPLRLQGRESSLTCRLRPERGPAPAPRESRGRRLLVILLRSSRFCSRAPFG